MMLCVKVRVMVRVRVRFLRRLELRYVLSLRWYNATSKWKRAERHSTHTDGWRCAP